MDENLGKLRILEQKEADPLLNRQERGEKIDHFFHVGEEVTLKGSLFRIQSVTPKGLRLKVLRRPSEKN